MFTQSLHLHAAVSFCCCLIRTQFLVLIVRNQMSEQYSFETCAGEIIPRVCQSWQAIWMSGIFAHSVWCFWLIYSGLCLTAGLLHSYHWSIHLTTGSLWLLCLQCVVLLVYSLASVSLLDYYTAFVGPLISPLDVTQLLLVHLSHCWVLQSFRWSACFTIGWSCYTSLTAIHCTCFRCYAQ